MFKKTSRSRRLRTVRKLIQLVHEVEDMDQDMDQDVDCDLDPVLLLTGTQTTSSPIPEQEAVFAGF